MGLFDEAASTLGGGGGGSSSSRKHRSHKSSSGSHKSSRHRSRSRESRGVASIFGGSGGHKKNASRSSLFGGTTGSDKDERDERQRRGSGDGAKSFFNLPLGNTSRGSFFSFGTGRSPSYYKRSPRQSFMQRSYKKLKRLLRDLVHYAKRHPMKVFMLVIMPLITGGALTALLARFGLRMPAALENMLGLGARAMSAGGGGAPGLVGEAVRMASGAGAAAAATSAVARASSGLGLGETKRSWERRTTYRSAADDDDWYRDLSYGSSSVGAGAGGGAGGGWMSSVSKFFS